MFYTLKTPFKSRKNGEDIQIVELAMPDVITVGMMRKVASGNALLAAHSLAEVCAGLSVIDGSKLESPDAIEYSNLMADKLTAHELAGFEIPPIKPVRALVAKITADINNQQIEFAAQVLQHSGMKREVIDAMEIGAFLPAVPTIVGAFIGPKN